MYLHNVFVYYAYEVYISKTCFVTKLMINNNYRMELRALISAL